MVTWYSNNQLSLLGDHYSTMSRVQSCQISESDLLKLYNGLDKDDNGLLDEDELKVLMRKIGMPESYAKLCLLLSGKGKAEINFKEFQNFLALLLLYKSDKPQFLKLVFNALDADDSGTLELDEVFVFLRLLDIQCTVQQAAKILLVADDNSDMKLNLKEFSDLIEGLERAID